MDGNGRWAKKRLLSRIKGHERGSESVRTVVRTSRELGIRYLTLFAFSTENWRRPRAEVDALMELLKRFLKSEREEMLTNDIRLHVLGQLQRLPADVRQSLEETVQMTRANGSLQLNLALSYGAREEITHAARELVRLAAAGRLSADDVTEAAVAQHLYTHGIPDPDLLIRTSGEMRISNFLLWQSAYTELYVTPTLWPDFGKKEFLQILKEFEGRERRFGRI
jgi:undecaprenyl diphosphate synthase